VSLRLTRLVVLAWFADEGAPLQLDEDQEFDGNDDAGNLPASENESKWSAADSEPYGTAVGDVRELFEIVSSLLCGTHQGLGNQTLPSTTLLLPALSSFHHSAPQPLSSFSHPPSIFLFR
jgi:hypothetical protein